MIQNTFKSFFQEHFFQVDRKYVDVRMPLLNEMAMRNDIVKQPVRFDKDDIQFLQQFPPEYWAQAKKQRYDDLFDAVHGRSGKRRPTEEKLENMFRAALYSGNHEALKGHISDELMKDLYHGRWNHVVGNRNLTDLAAKSLSETEAEKLVPHVSEPQDEGLPPGYKRFVFRIGRRGSKTTSIIAKPFLNRLAHKLERTRDHEHHPESGLHDLGVKSGEYGYDLYDPKKGKGVVSHSTRGMQFPNEDEIGRRMSSFLNHNAHQMYGNLPEGDDIRWMPVGSGRTQYRDNWSWKRRYEDLLSHHMNALRHAEGAKFDNMSQLRKAAHRAALAQVVQEVESGKLRGHPVPGVAPQGLPITIKNRKGVKTPEGPLLYLPHRETKVRVQTPNGNSKFERKWVPVVNPTEYLRRIGSDESDEFMTPDDPRLRGHDKGWVAVTPQQYSKKKDYLAAGALHLTHNSAGRMYLDPSDPEYQEKIDELTSDMTRCNLDNYNRPTAAGSGPYFYDIVKGIWNCISSACGGMTSHEVQIMTQSVPDLHQLVWQHFQMNLRNPKIASARGRRAFARNVASSWAQQDLGKGGGTRRLRRLSDKGRHADLDAAVGESGTMSQESLIDGLRAKMNKEMASSGAGGKLAQGGKSLPAGSHQFSYNIDKMRKLLSDLEKEAEENEVERFTALKMSRDEIGQHVTDMLEDMLQDRAAIMMKMQLVLTGVYETIRGLPPNEAQGMAMQKLSQYGANKKTPYEVLQAFQADSEIQELLNKPQPAVNPDEAPVGLAAEDSLNRLRDVLGKIPPAMLQQPGVRNQIMSYIENEPKEFHPILKKEFDKITDVATTPAPTAMAAKAIAPAAAPVAAAPAAGGVRALIDQKKWLDVAHHPVFIQKADPQRLQAVIGKLQQEMQATNDPETREEHELAIHHLQFLLSKRGSNEIGNIT